VVQNQSKLDRLISEAARFHRQGRPEEAAQSAKAAVAIDSNSVAARFLLGVISARSGDRECAYEMLESVLRMDPRSFETLISLSTLYREDATHGKAIALAERAVQVQPRQPAAWTHLGRCLLADRRLEKSALAFLQATEIDSAYAPAYYHLGKSRQLEGRDGDAAIAYSRAFKLAPTQENLLALGQSLLTVADFESALACAKKGVETFPQSAAAHLLLCGALTEASLFEDATFHLNRAIELDPLGDEALQTAIRQRPLGFVEEANNNLRRVIATHPRLVSAYDMLVQNKKVDEQDRDVVLAMQKLLAEAQLAPTEKLSLHYGLGKALEDLGEFEQAMRHYDEANLMSRQMKMGEAQFDRIRYSNQIDNLMQIRSETWTSTCSSSLPIVILGMMRSGTTLAEQILSSHPQVRAAGEQLFWTFNHGEVDFSDPSSAGRLGERYVKHLESFAKGAPHVTDKMPGNYLYAGLIHQALPNVRIIHMRRSPVDTCLSIWATPNHMPHEGGNEKAGIVFVYQQYLKIMEHWRRVLPANRFLEVDYELLVSNPKQVTENILKFCQLDWYEGCLHPEVNSRTVLTPSAWQVRQPIYRSSVHRWKNFEPWLGDFRDLL
jgi:tetratricopeptide (TPR) repeat protein